jgi:hypothetical protein
MTSALVNFQKICSLPLVWLVSLEASLENEAKKGFFQLNHWWFSRKTKCLTVVAIVAVLLISVFAFLPKQIGSKATVVVPQSSDNPTATPSPTSGSKHASSSNIDQWFNLNEEVPQTPSPPRPPGIIGSAQTINNTVWKEVAADAWAYFQPGIGVDSKTGLPYAGGPSCAYFTDWDLGVYIQAAIDAQKIGLISNDSAWDFSARINDVLTFLETRPLNTTTNYPFQFYEAATEQEYTLLQSNEIVDVVDTGRLFVALNNLINFNSSLTTRVDNIVLNGRSNYAALVPSIASSADSNSIYAYYVDSGFASFWPDQLSNVPSEILSNIFSGGTNITYGVSLPISSITGDPLLCSVFELNNNDSRLMALSWQVYAASDAYYCATGDYVAYGEGNGPFGYMYEWVIMPNGDTWNITDGSGAYLNINPIIYTKIAFSFLALYNTSFARSMAVYLEECLPTPTNGYSDGVDNYGNAVKDVGSNTNGLILDAAQYYIQNNP